MLVGGMVAGRYDLYTSLPSLFFIFLRLHSASFLVFDVFRGKETERVGLKA